jgi:hypothetical protein
MRQASRRTESALSLGLVFALVITVAPPAYFLRTDGSLLYSAIGVGFVLVTYAVAAVVIQF